MATNYKILRGPSKWDLMLSLFDSTMGSPRYAWFKVTPEDHNSKEPKSMDFCVLVNGVSREDGSSESWIFNGYSAGRKVNGWFRTTNREGRLELADA
jgi:hypothetical protein